VFDACAINKVSDVVDPYRATGSSWEKLGYFAVVSIFSQCIVSRTFNASGFRANSFASGKDKMRPLLVVLLVIALTCTVSNGVRAQEGSGVDWPTFNGTLDGHRYSTLKQINSENVKLISPAWAFQTAIVNPSTSFENTPIVVDGVMYVSTGVNVIYAMKADTGELLYRFDPEVKVGPDALTQLKLCCGHNNRGLAFYKDRIYMGTLDGRLIALHKDHLTRLETFVGDGKIPGEAQLFKLKDGYSITAAPIVWNDMIFVGAAGSEFRTRGQFSAYDANTGKLIWRWYTVPSPQDPGGETWPDKSSGPFWNRKKIYQEGGVGVWMNPVIDTTSIKPQVIFGTGNPNPDFNGGGRAGDNLYSCSVVSLDAKTGKLNWYFQEVRHDLWDYDQSAPPILFTTNITGQPVEAVGMAGKTGWFYILDRKTGVPLIEMKDIDVPQDSKLATAKQQRVPAVVEPFVKHTETMWSPPTLNGVHIAPGLSGGSEWSPLSYNPELKLAYVSAIEKQMQFCLVPHSIKDWLKHVPDDVKDCRNVADLEELASLVSPLNLGGVAVVSKDDPAPKGAFVAINVDTDKVVWKYETTPHPISGTLATAGNLVFAGESNGYFDAFQADNGTRLWQFQTGSSINAAPMTYSVNGRQYVAIAAGGLASSSLPNHPGTGESKDWQNFRQGGTVFVFALPNN